MATRTSTSPTRGSGPSDGINVRVYTNTMSKVYHVAPEDEFPLKEGAPVPIMCELNPSAVARLVPATKQQMDKRKMCTNCVKEVEFRTSKRRSA